VISFTFQFPIVEGVLILKCVQAKVGSASGAWKNVCGRWEGNSKFTRDPWKALELRRGCRSLLVVTKQVST